MASVLCWIVEMMLEIVDDSLLVSVLLVAFATSGITWVKVVSGSAVKKAIVLCCIVEIKLESVVND